MTSNKQRMYATQRIWLRSLLYVCLLFISALSLLGYLYFHKPDFSTQSDWTIYLFFFLLAVFTDFKGFPHPNLGYVSFDRVTQVSSILILGPIPAALINGTTSFLFPILKNYFNGSKRARFIAAINNSAMIVLMILLSSLLYEFLGGVFSLSFLNLKLFALLSVLLISMQITNSIFMRILIQMRKQKIQNYFSPFTTSVEISSGVVGILFAIVFNVMEFNVIVLFVVVLVISIFAINQFAIMRNQLENIVEQRTKDLQLKTQQLEYLAEHDELTGLVNRRFINRHIKQLLDNQNIDNNSIYVGFADIDDFKSINDEYSHDVGDEVLLKIGEVLQHFSNKMFIISRYGGEEFLLCFDTTNKQMVLQTCESIRQAIKDIDFNHIEPAFNITVSVGVVNAREKSLHKTLISRADENLYQAKANGKNQIIYSD